MDLFDLSAKITMDMSGYLAAVRKATKEGDKLSGGFRHIVAGAQAATNKVRVMSAQYTAAKARVLDLTKAFNESAKANGFTSEKTQTLAKKLSEAQKEASGLKAELQSLKHHSDNAGHSFSKFAKSLGAGLKKGAEVGTKAVGIAAAGIATLAGASLKSFSEYEQLVGGAELMFGDAYKTVADNAKNAYATVQLSQNDYLQQVNGFATGLSTALDGNKQAAAELAHDIVKAEADVIAATGNTKENVQNAFNGIMKSNYTIKFSLLCA